MPNQKYHPAEKYTEMLPEAPGERNPLISYFSGIFIRVHLGGQQQLHAEYGGNEAIFDFEGNLLEGGLPAKQQMYIAVWADMRRTELDALWRVMHTEDTYFKIKGLE